MMYYHHMITSDPRFLSGLPVLAAVLASKSFVRAGEALGLTQSGVSRAIQRLEDRLGLRLFERTSKMVRLTEAGKKKMVIRVALAHKLLVRLNAKARDARAEFANAT